MDAAGTRDDTVNSDYMKATDNLRTNVRFSPDEFLKIKKDETTTGKSIPWLLKTAYFQRGLSAPTLDAETRLLFRQLCSRTGDLIGVNSLSSIF